MKLLKLLITLIVSGLIPWLALQNLNFSGQTLIGSLALAFMCFASGWVIGEFGAKILKY